jgi:hypothetical protein
MTTNRKYVRLRKPGKPRASQREDLTAATMASEAWYGVDVIVSDPPVRSRRGARHAQLPDPDVEKRHAADLARVWLVVVVACVAAFAGCVAAAGAMLMVTQEPTWHVWVAATAGLGWFVAGCAFAAHVDRLHRWARGEEPDAPRT